MATTDLVRYQDSFGADVELSITDIKRTLCPKATDQEAANFLHLCRYMGLNPFVRDAYLIKYGDKEASMVVGKDAFTKRADSHPQFGGMESGVIVRTGDKEPVNRKGTLVLDGEKLVGGWARVARADRKLDTDTTVSFGEFDTGRSMWQKMPATMIEKVAIVKALRTAFPATFSGLYDQAEMGIDLSADMEPMEPEGFVETVPEATRASPNVLAIDPNKPNHKDQPDPECYDCQDDAAEAGVIIESDPLEALADIVPPANCTKDGHEPGQYEVITNEATQESRWAHRYSYTLNGQTKQGWCVSDVPVGQG